MDKMKKFRTYFFIFVALAGILYLLTMLGTHNLFRDMKNYKIKGTSPKIEVLESKISPQRGFLKVKVQNNTGEAIEGKYIKADFYNQKNEYIGTQYRRIFHIEENDSKDMSMEYNFREVAKMEIGIETAEIRNTKLSTTEKNMAIAMPVAALLILCFL